MSREQVRRPEIVVDLGAIRRNVGRLRDLVAPDGSDVMVVVKADGYGHGMVESARAARAGRCALARRRHHRRGARGCARPATPGRLLCWLTVPGDDWAAAIDARRRRHGVHRWPSSTRSAAAVAGTPARRPAQDRHRPLARRLDRASTGPTLLAAARAGEADGRLAGHRHLVALRLQRRARRTPPTTPRSAPSATRSPAPSAAGLRPEVRHLANSGRRAPAAAAAASTWCAAGSRRTASTRPPASAPTSACEPAMTVTAPLALTKRPPRRRRRLLRPHLDRARRRPASAWSRSGTATGCRATPATPPRSGSTASAGRSAAGSAWTSSSSTSATTQAGAPATRSCCSGRARTGEPTADDWARACGTIHYEIVTRMGGRLQPPLRRGDAAMSATRKVLSVAAGSPPVRSASPPPAPRYRVAQRRAVISASRRGRRDAVRLAALGPDHRRRRRRRTPCTSRSTSTPAPDAGAPQGAGADRRLRPRLLAQPRLAGTSSARPTAARCARSSTTSAPTAAPGARRPGHATIEQLGHDLKTVLDTVVPHGPIVLVGHSMGGMTIMALAEEHPELFGDRIVGVGLISTTAGGLEPHRIAACPMLPSTLGGAARAAR